MKARKLGISLTGRLQTGVAILAAAQVVDSTLVKRRLRAFASAQRSYAEAQRQVEAAGAELRERRVRLARRDAQQDDALEALARALVGGGQPRRNPVAAFGTPAPWVLKHMTAVAAAKAIHQLVAAVRRQKTVCRATLHAAQTAEQAARRVETAQRAMDQIHMTLSNTRRARDRIGQTWAMTLAALKLEARAAAADGAPGLYPALFGPPGRSRKKTVRRREELASLTEAQESIGSNPRLPVQAQPAPRPLLDSSSAAVPDRSVIGSRLAAFPVARRLSSGVRLPVGEAGTNSTVGGFGIDGARPWTAQTVGGTTERVHGSATAAAAPLPHIARPVAARTSPARSSATSAAPPSSPSAPTLPSRARS